jgi:hypothetical protein
MPTLLSFLIRLILVAAGLLFAASLAVAFMLMLSVWVARAAWAKLAGRPVMPFIVRIDPRAGFRRAAPRSSAVRARRQPADISDVEPRTPGA